jgi:hypothetical protein
MPRTDAVPAVKMSLSLNPATATRLRERSTDMERSLAALTNDAMKMYLWYLEEVKDKGGELFIRRVDGSTERVHVLL